MRNTFEFVDPARCACVLCCARHDSCDARLKKLQLKQILECIERIRAMKRATLAMKRERKLKWPKLEARRSNNEHTQIESKC